MPPPRLIACTLMLLALALPAASQAPSKQPNLIATLWLQTAAEYAALALQSYRQAQAQLAPALREPAWSASLEQRKLPRSDYAELPPAVILDLDETVFDNSQVQGEFVAAGGFDPQLWDAWVARAEADAVPGAREFAQAAQALGITLVYVTNRGCAPRPGDDGRPCPQESDSIRNLERLGFVPPRPAEILLRGEQPGWNREKSQRRMELSRQYRILLMIGDDLGDFLPGVRGLPAPERRQQALAHKDFWGAGWFLLPNPVYGSWLRALGTDPAAHLETPDPPLP